MSEQQNRDTLERFHREAMGGQDIDAMAELMHDDYLEEYPPSPARGFAASKTREASMRTIRACRT